jgi:uncharacterized membrane protein YwzB
MVFASALIITAGGQLGIVRKGIVPLGGTAVPHCPMCSHLHHSILQSMNQPLAKQTGDKPMNDQQKQAFIDLILLAVTMGMTVSSFILLILGEFSLDTLNLVLIGVVCGWLFKYRRTQSNQSLLEALEEKES